jgi:1-phosphatidylinositol phosphodiesterase
MTTTWANNWMSGVKDDAPISEMSIPGTHESSARVGGGLYQCQWRSITDLLNRGIRFLDIRCRILQQTETGYDPVRFRIYHGNTVGGDQYITFEEVQAQCIWFLEQNPSEFIMMNVQWEIIDNASDGEKFRDTFWKLTEPYRQHHWYLRETGTPGHEFVPRLSDVRGRIMLLRPYYEDGADTVGWPGFPANAKPPVECGSVWRGFNVNGTSANGIFETQNAWSTLDGGPKGDLVEQYIRDAGPNAAKNKLTLNFASYARDSQTPGRNADGMNKRLKAYLAPDQNTGFRNLGVINLDFASNTGDDGYSLENLIIERQPHQMPGTMYGGLNPDMYPRP